MSSENQALEMEEGVSTHSSAHSASHTSSHSAEKYKVKSETTVESQTDVVIADGSSKEQPPAGGGSSRSGIITNYVVPCVAELIQVLLFVFVGTLCLANVGSVTGAAIAHGLTIVLLMLNFMHISGGHINPVVTLGVALSGAISPVLAVLYAVSQFLGGILGAAFCLGVLGKDNYVTIHGGGQMLDPMINGGQALFCEMMITFVLVLTVLMMMVDYDRRNDLAPFAIGFAVLVGITGSGTLTGGSMNPARSFGPAVVLSMANSTAGKDLWKDHWVFWVGPILGAALAAAAYKLFFAKSEKRMIKF